MAVCSKCAGTKLEPDSMAQSFRAQALPQSKFKNLPSQKNKLLPKICPHCKGTGIEPGTTPNPEMK